MVVVVGSCKETLSKFHTNVLLLLLLLLSSLLLSEMMVMVVGDCKGALSQPLSVSSSSSLRDDGGLFTLYTY